MHVANLIVSKGLLYMWQLHWSLPITKKFIVKHYKLKFSLKLGINDDLHYILSIGIDAIHQFLARVRAAQSRIGLYVTALMHNVLDCAYRFVGRRSIVLMKVRQKQHTDVRS